MNRADWIALLRLGGTDTVVETEPSPARERGWYWEAVHEHGLQLEHPARERGPGERWLARWTRYLLILLGVVLFAVLVASVLLLALVEDPTAEAGGVLMVVLAVLGMAGRAAYRFFGRKRLVRLAAWLYGAMAAVTTLLVAVSSLSSGFFLLLAWCLFAPAFYLICIGLTIPRFLAFFAAAFLFLVVTAGPAEDATVARAFFRLWQFGLLLLPFFLLLPSVVGLRHAAWPRWTLRTRRAGPRSGVTLIELLVVIACLGILSVGAVSVWSAGARGMQRSRARLAAVAVAETALEQVRAGLALPRTGDEAPFPVAPAALVALGEAHLVYTRALAADGLVDDVTLTVHWTDLDGARRYTVVTQVLPGSLP